eukprot:Nitzschia sp. Nitz4//scaffold5_size260463//47006//47728//NITZ4_000950-RA/size260463-processed-gene-0.55-mRNA-1//1//CDS//3329555244//4864//frame0
MTDNSSSKQRWFPLESNPQLINEYIQKLGFDTSLYEFCDVYSTDEWALEMIPSPVAAVLLVYPLTDTITKSEQETSQTIDTEAAEDKVWYIRQRIGNACGTIGLLHALLNVPEGIRIFTPGSWLEDFQRDCPVPLSPIAKAERLEKDGKIAKLHDAATSSESNATGRGSLDDKVETHFVAFVHVQGNLYEMDGRKAGPVLHGKTTQKNLLQDACKVIQSIMARDPTESRFAITALAPAMS